MNEPTTLLKNATGTTTGTPFDMWKAHRTFTFYKSITGVFTTLALTFEGSLDGSNWFSLATDTTLVAGATFVVDKPCRYLRVSVTGFTGGTNVSVDVLPCE